MRPVADGGIARRILDPHTEAPARSPWRTVSVTTATCADADTAGTAALVYCHRAVTLLEHRDLPARPVRHDASALVLGGRPPDPAPGGTA